MSVTINHSGGARTVAAYRVLSDPMRWELTGNTNRAGSMVTRGDRGKRPAALEIQLQFQEATFQEGIDLANTVIGEARTATSLDLPRGNRAVNGISGRSIRTSGLLVTLTLAFKPTSGAYT